MHFIALVKFNQKYLLEGIAKPQLESYHKNKSQRKSKVKPMSSLADKIEQYIKVLIDRSDSGSIEIQRLELAETFACAPSQITYVISTRFSPQLGFWVESKRGGSGYVRVSRIHSVSGVVSREEALLILRQLLEERRLTTREYFILKTVVDTLDASNEIVASEAVLDQVLSAILRLL